MIFGLLRACICRHQQQAHIILSLVCVYSGNFHFYLGSYRCDVSWVGPFFCQLKFRKIRKVNDIFVWEIAMNRMRVREIERKGQKRVR